MTLPGTVTEPPHRDPPPSQATAEAQHGLTPLGIGRRIRSAAAASERDLPVLSAAGHLRDAAGAAEKGRWEGARRHLAAAMRQYAPASLLAHGIFDDNRHTLARQHLSAAHRVYLQVREAEDSGR